MHLFAPPPVLNTVVVFRVPDKYRKARRTEWSTINAGGREIDTFLEGPSFDRAGNLHVVDIPNGRIFRISPRGDWAVVTEYDGEPKLFSWPSTGGVGVRQTPPISALPSTPRPGGANGAKPSAYNGAGAC